MYIISIYVFKKEISKVDKLQEILIFYGYFAKSEYSVMLVTLRYKLGGGGEKSLTDYKYCYRYSGTSSWCIG